MLSDGPADEASHSTRIGDDRRSAADLRTHRSCSSCLDCIVACCLAAGRTPCLRPLAKTFERRPLMDFGLLLCVGIVMASLFFTFNWICIPVLGLVWHSGWVLAVRAVFLMTVSAFYRTIITNPGGVPRDKWGDIERPPREEDVQERKQLRKEMASMGMHRCLDGGLRWCKKEGVWKPDRAHFCRQLGRNVLRMDHFCPWLGTCIGYYNHKYFLLGLLYSTCDVSLVGYTCFRAIMFHMPNALETVVLGQGLLVSLILAAVLIPYSCFQLWLLANNMTTIEYCEAGGNLGISRYDYGLLSNVTCVLGSQWWLWWLPVGGPDGDGTKWPRKQGLQALSLPLSGVFGALAELCDDSYGLVAAFCNADKHLASANPMCAAAA